MVVGWCLNWSCFGGCLLPLFNVMVVMVVMRMLLLSLWLVFRGFALFLELARGLCSMK
jgi:hypothetical protein